ncbi:ribonuclease h2, subunit c [Grosmannia clavigera kw1407]|uniref:Ribonuclease h2, subunit c n=1 Tax=Grosmannia clavigera (strain kw1407 / UAMH 11150) TaxID=655863 RepID=F0XSR2_GROCL|nr:ribonuclease h2, subunit c [Grosmannia clavigera kw1407]EFW99203.1 ribonuclease h2, subunit c [Grosmannia clavigera kw1407]
MAQHMLQITSESASAPPQVKPHLLPCRIHHTGPVGATDLFWAPKTEGTKHTAYFRGRKLCGHAVHVPEGYRGVVGARQPSAQEQARQRNEPEEIIDVDADVDDQAAQRQQTVTGGLAVLAEFDEMIVWGHHSAPDAATDAHMRGVDEWLALSEQIHSYPKDEGDGTGKATG